MELYFFRDLINYKELKEKTDSAYKRNSKNKRRINILKKIELTESEASYIYNNFRNENQYIIDNIQIMTIKNGIWQCIEMTYNEKAILVMSDGFPYARFVAMR